MAKLIINETKNSKFNETTWSKTWDNVLSHGYKYKGSDENGKTLRYSNNTGHTVTLRSDGVDHFHNGKKIANFKLGDVKSIDTHLTNYHKNNKFPVVKDNTVKDMVSHLTKAGFVKSKAHPSDIEATSGSTTYQHPKSKKMVHVWPSGEYFHQSQPGNTNNERDFSGSGHKDLKKNMKDFG